jgi:hypothetical protein
VPSKDISLTGIVAGGSIGLLASAFGMTDPQHFERLSFALFAISILVFYVSVAMPIKFKRRTPDEK